MQFGHPTEDFLTSIGFRFSPPRSLAALPVGFSYSKLRRRHHRLQCRKDVGDMSFGRILEGVVSQVLLGTFKYDAITGVRIEDEGSGGDYDVLAFTPPYLLYVECKSGRSLGFGNILRRHEFLRPALTLVIHDVTRRVLENVSLKEVQAVLRRKAIAENPDLTARSHLTPQLERVSAVDRSYALFHMQRNVFIASGEDLENALRMTLRYFHQVVAQTSYWV